MNAPKKIFLTPEFLSLLDFATERKNEDEYEYSLVERAEINPKQSAKYQVGQKVKFTVSSPYEWSKNKELLGEIAIIVPPNKRPDACPEYAAIRRDCLEPAFSMAKRTYESYVLRVAKPGGLKDKLYWPRYAKFKLVQS